MTDARQAQIRATLDKIGLWTMHHGNGEQAAAYLQADVEQLVADLLSTQQDKPAYDADKEARCLFQELLEPERTVDKAAKAMSFLRLWANSYLLNGNYWDVPQTMGAALNQVIAVLDERLSHQQGQDESHRCARCGHRWEGKLLGAEYCGDCHRAAQARQDKTKVDAAIHESTVRVLQNQRDTLRKRNEELLTQARQGWQPIETAPKEEGWFLSASADMVHLVCRVDGEIRDLGVDPRSKDIGLYESAFPLLVWMPLPPVPAQEPSE